MIRFALLVVTCLAFTLLAVQIADDDVGYVLISYQNATIELSLVKYLFFSAALFFFFYILLRVPGTFIARNGPLRRWFLERRERSNRELANKGMMAFAEGDWELSRKSLVKSANSAPSPEINYLFAAKASQALGARAQSEKYLELAGAGVEPVTLGLAKAQLQLDHGQFPECSATLNKLYEEVPRHPVVLKMLIEVYGKLKEWQKLIDLLPELRKNKVVSGDEFERLQSRAYSAMLAQLPLTSEYISIDLANSLWNKFSGSVKKNSLVLAAYVRLLLQVGEAERQTADDTAEKLLRAAIKKQWDDELVELYGKVKSQDLAAQYGFAVSLIPARPNNAALTLCLGRLAMAQSDLTKAKEHLEASLALEKSPQALAELGRLTAAMGEHQESHDYLQDALAMQSKTAAKLPVLS